MKRQSSVYYFQIIQSIHLPLVIEKNSLEWCWEEGCGRTSIAPPKSKAFVSYSTPHKRIHWAMVLLISSMCYKILEYWILQEVSLHAELLFVVAYDLGFISTLLKECKEWRLNSPIYCVELCISITNVVFQSDVVLSSAIKSDRTTKTTDFGTLLLLAEITRLPLLALNS